MIDEIVAADLAEKWGWPLADARTALEFLTEAGIDPDEVPVLFNPED